MTHTITLDVDDSDALTALAVAYPGITLHLAHLAVFRLGLRLAVNDPTLLADELATIGEVRRERRRHGRLAKSEAAITVDRGTGEAGNG